MSSDDHCYTKCNYVLSQYAQNLDSVSKSDYIKKLTIEKPDGVFSFPDPYCLEKQLWKDDMTGWPKITKTEIDDYLSRFPGKNTRSHEAFKYVTAGKVQNTCMYIPPNLSEWRIIKGEVYPSMKSTGPHYPWILATDGEIRTAHCTCLAGLGEVCSHVMSVLYTIKFAVDADLTGVPTEKQCQWTKFNKRVKPAPLSDIDLKKPKLPEDTTLSREVNVIPVDNTVPPITDEELQELKKISPESVFFTSYTDDSSTDTASENEDEDIPLTMLEICKRFIINDVKSMLPHFDKIKIKNLEHKTRNQRNVLWREHRRGRLTASNFGEILKKRKVSDKFIDKFISIHSEINVEGIKWDIKKEDTAYQAYKDTAKENHVNFTIRKCGFFILESDPYLGCSPDGIIECACCGKGVIEIKCPYKHRNMSPIHISRIDKAFCLNNENALKEEHNFYAQVQGQMAITNTNYCDFVIWTTKDIFIHRVVRDKHYWDMNKPILERFFFKDILPALKRNNNIC